jgi:two-component system CheB/CheR fusion protein
LKRIPNAPAIQIFATDIDEDAIDHSREGYYTLVDVADVSAERLQQFFTRDGSGFRVRRELREKILFAKHNLLKDAPFSRLDLVTCRNLLIYFNNTAQERAIETFHFALNPGAFLFLGTSESTDGAGDLYAPVNKEHRIYQSRQAATRIPYPVPDRAARFAATPREKVVGERWRREFPKDTKASRSNASHSRFAPAAFRAIRRAFGCR